MKPALPYRKYRPIRRRLKLAAHILSSAAGVLEGEYPIRTLDRLDSIRYKTDAFLRYLDAEQYRARHPHHRVDDDG